MPTYVYMYVCTYVYMHVCMYVYMHVCMHAIEKSIFCDSLFCSVVEFRFGYF